MRIYVAGSSKDIEKIREIIQQLWDAGHEITHDWTINFEHLQDIVKGEDKEQARKVSQVSASHDRQGVLDADFLIWCVSSNSSHGAPWEAGLFSGLHFGNSHASCVLWLDERDPALIFASSYSKQFDKLEEVLVFLSGLEALGYPVSRSRGRFFGSLDIISKSCSGLARKAKWNTEFEDHPLFVPAMLMLIVSELSEAMEGERKDRKDEHLPQYKSFWVEMADALIRIFDLIGRMGVPIAEVVMAKLAYNQQRADHKLANRAKKGGKKY